MAIKVNPKIKNDFPWFKNNPGWTYLDSSASALKPQCVIDTIDEYYSKYSSNPHNTDSELTYNVVKKIADARAKIAKLFNATPDEIVFTSGATDGINMLSVILQPFLKPGDEIILTYGEHSSNFLPWFEMCNVCDTYITFAGAENQVPTEQDIIKSINSKTKIITFCNLSNLLGYELNIKKIVSAARRINKDIIVVIDATQGAPHKVIDVKKDDMDFFVCSGYKMMSGTGIGLLYMKKKWNTLLKPGRFGSGMNNEIFCDRYTLATGSNKFEAGTPNTAGILSWNTAVDYLNAYGWKNMLNYEMELKRYINQEFRKLKNVEYVNEYAKYPIVVFNIKGVHPQDTANYLAQKKIIVRSGLSCAKLSPKITGADGMVRASFYIYNDKKDVDALVKALRTYKKGSELDNVI